MSEVKSFNIRWTMVVDLDKCTGCGACLAACPNGALSAGEHGVQIDREKCRGCGTCADQCFSGALVLSGKEMDTEEVMAEVDILYMTRVQKERLDPSEYANVKAQFVLRASDLNGARANMKVLHPLPRIDEITTDVDKTPHAWYFQQAGNGIFARQALLALVLNSELAL